MKRNQSKYTVFGVAAIAAVMLVGGFYAYSFLDNDNQQGLSETLDFGGYGVLEAYHEDGTLYQKWEGHNSLTQNGRIILSQCLGGFTTDFEFCTGLLNEIVFSGTIFSSCENCVGDGGNRPADFVDTLLPEGCSVGIGPDNLNPCTGWKTSAIQDNSIFDCSADIRCIEFVEKIRTRDGVNEIIIDPPIQMGINDRLVATISFSLP